MTIGPWGRRWLVSTVFWFWVTPAPARLVLNEVHPDPPGSDAGREFVEIFNTGQNVASLAGVTLEFANGATGGPWEVRWTGAEGATLAPGARYLITDRNWLAEETPDAEVWLGLQNGPDAVRLTVPDGEMDLVGYGPLTDAALMEGSPAVLKVGLSLARRPDGRDTGDNLADFRSAEPSPGRANFRPYELAVRQLTLEPPSVDRPGPRIEATVGLANIGTETYGPGEAILTVGSVQVAGWLDMLPPEEQLVLAFGFTVVDEGALELALELPADGQGTRETMVIGRLQVGPGDLVLNEVMAAPAAREGEWLEVLAPGPTAVDLGEFRFADADGDTHGLPDGRLAAGELAVVAQDSAALTDWIAENRRFGVPDACDATGGILASAGWPNLNNTPPVQRDFADRLLLIDAQGAVVDHVTLGRSDLFGVEVGSGRSAERLAVIPANPGFANWRSSVAAAGATPGCPNSAAVRSNLTGEFHPDPPILDRAGAETVVHFTFDVRPEDGGWRLKLYDLWGNGVRDLGGDDLGPGPRSLAWDGSDEGGRSVGAGAYIAVLSTDSGRRKALVVVR